MKIKHHVLIAISLAIFTVHQGVVWGAVGASAWDIYQELGRQGITLKGEPIESSTDKKYNEGLVTFGAEKEGGDSKIALVMGPTSQDLKRYISSLYMTGGGKAKEFLLNFLKGLQSGEISEPLVYDMTGTKKVVSTKFLENVPLDKLHYKKLYSLFEKWLEQTQDRPFSFLKPQTRRSITNGKFPGGTHFLARRILGGTYRSWKPLFGEPERYITKAIPAGEFTIPTQGYELAFKVQKSYGDFERMLKWLNVALRDNPLVPEKNLSPGHIRMVWALPANEHPLERKDNRARQKELFRQYQSYVVLRGLAGNTGMLTAKWKDVHEDHKWKTLKTWKGVLRAEYGRWPYGHRFINWNWRYPTGGVEIRSGSKDPETQELLMKVLAARVGANEFEDLSKLSDWKLIPESLGTLGNPLHFFAHEHALNKLATNHQLPKEDLRRFFRALRNIKQGKFRNDPRSLNYKFLAPLWYWQNAPFISEEKKAMVRDMTKEFINKVLDEKSNLTFDRLENLLSIWSKRTQLDRDLQAYLVPKRGQGVAPVTQGDHILEHSANKKVKDVNQIDLGIEYTAKMPIKDSSFHSMNLEQRKQLILGVAQGLKSNLRLGDDYQVVESKELKAKKDDKSSHGHSIEVSYTLINPKNPDQVWRVEWDGIVREYNHDGSIKEGSPHGGVIELVTPKFLPQQEQIQAVFKTFQDHSLIPNDVSGGGHVNVDLNAFNANPQAMAKFLTLFHTYRGIASVLFQHPQRLKFAEPVNISKSLDTQLRNFQGTEEELKKLLYNERYFNRRMGRKTRYNQIDLSYYFQDVIPPEFISEDFDIHNPREPWRPQFRVRPQLRKMEMRLMDAPRTPQESELQMLFVRALLNRAFNMDKPIPKRVTDIENTKENILKLYRPENANLAIKELSSMCEDLEIDCTLFQNHLGQSLSRNQLYFHHPQNKNNFENVFEELDKTNARYPGLYWEQAVPLRPISEGLAFDERPFASSAVVLQREAKDYNQEKLEHFLQNQRRTPRPKKVRDLVACRGQLAKDNKTPLRENTRDIQKILANLPTVKN